MGKLLFAPTSTDRHFNALLVEGHTLVSRLAYLRTFGLVSLSSPAGGLFIVARGLSSGGI
jgi:hypothetical protein